MSMLSRRASLTCVLTGLMIAIGAQPVLAQFGVLPAGGRPGTVSGTGIASIEKQPETMRMHIELMAKAGSLKEALKALGQRKEAARKTLEKLGAAMESIRFGQPTVSDAQSPQQQQMAEMMSMIEEQRNRTGRLKTNKTSVPVTVTCPLSVGWKLDFDSAEELLLFAHPLQQELRQADLSGSKDVSALTPEQEEMIEEMQGEFGYDRGYYSSGEEEPGTPVFTFVAAISEEEQDRALADAFQQAKADAARLSKATGAELGKLVSVTSSDTTQDEDYSTYDEASYYLAQRLQQIGVSQSSSAANEAIGLQPGTVRKSISVTAWFDFKE